MSMVEEFVSPGSCRAAAHCWRCNRSGGLTLGSDGRFVCRGWCGRLDEEIVAEKGRSWVGQSLGRSSGKADRSRVATGGALGPGLAPAHISVTEPAGVTSTGGS